MQLVVLLSGRTCNGKTRLARRLREDYGFKVLDTSAYLQTVASARDMRPDRPGLQRLGDALDRETDSKWVLDLLEKMVREAEASVPIVVDNIRNTQQLLHIRRRAGWKVVHAHLYAPDHVLERRYRARLMERGGTDVATHRDADLIKSETDIETFKRDADVRIHTDRTDSGDTFVRVAPHLGLFPPPDIRCVDVIVGGQYGSEGKGHVAAYLAREYDVLVRVGGPNAGHTVSSESGVYTYHHLPSGCRDTDAEVLIGPGATLYVPKLLQEISECQLSPERLSIDPQAAIIEERDKLAEADLVAGIGSTGSGSGSAAARKITDRHSKNIRLARDVGELKPYVRSTLNRLERAYAQGKFILLEGTQGSGLSLHHGLYPHVTSRDTNVAGCLAEAGISASRVRRVLMVVRPRPIRVESPSGGTSGPLKHEVDFDEVARHAGLDADDVKQAERTSTTKRKRRVGWFDWELFRRSCALNVPTDIILTFADYLKQRNQNARRFEQLDSDTIKFIEELERVAQAPVSLINTRFPRSDEERLDLRSVIDRRKWWARPRKLGDDEGEARF